MHFSARIVLALALLAPTFAYAQDGGAIADRVQGRNSWLKEKLQPLGQKVSAHVVQLKGGKATGYGVVVPGGYVLTSDGLIGSATSLAARDASGKGHRVLVHGRNGKHGVALLRFVSPDDAPAPIALGSSRALEIGQIVAVCGTDATPLSAGVISATRRPVDKNAIGGGGNVFLQLFSDGSNQGHTRAFPAVLQHDGPLQPEFFGAPLVTRSGKLVGINVAYPFRGSAHAIGIDEIKSIMKELEAGAKVPTPEDLDEPTPPVQPEGSPPAPGSRPHLGASLAPASPAQLGKGHAFGLYVRELKAGGPAAQGGLLAKDVIVKLDGKPFKDINAFAAQLLLREPGDTVTLTVLRGAAGVEVEVKIVLGAR